MNLELIANNFVKLIKNNNIIAIGGFEKEKIFLEYIVEKVNNLNLKVYFVPTSSRQAKILHDLSQDMISLNDKEIDLAIEFVDHVDSYYNFIKKETFSFIRDKMIAQSALNLVVVSTKDLVESLDTDIYLEISTFAWQRTVLNLQSYGLARVVKDLDGNFVKTEIGHYLARLTLDKNISLEDFESSVRNIPGVLETGLFIGLAETVFIYDEKQDKVTIKIR